MAAVAARDDIRARMRRGELVLNTRITFAECAAQWLEQRVNLRPGTLGCYEREHRLYLLPRLGHRRMSSITSDDVARLAADLQRRGLAGSTIRSVLVNAGQVFDYAVRRGFCPSNPIRRLERSERPQVVRPEVRFLDSDEIERLLQAAQEPFRTAIATAVFTGLRLGELTGLEWGDVDFAAGVIRVRRQAMRLGNTAPLKTAYTRRDVLLTPALAAMLREHRLRSRYSQDDEHVFVRVKPAGLPMQQDTLRKALRVAAEKAGLNAPGKPALRIHDLRHTYASLLIAQGCNVAFVSRQLGHASITTTLNTYTHLFDHAQHAASVVQKLEDGFAHMLTPTEQPAASTPVSERAP